MADGTMERRSFDSLDGRNLSLDHLHCPRERDGSCLDSRGERVPPGAPRLTVGGSAGMAVDPQCIPSGTGGDVVLSRQGRSVNFFGSDHLRGDGDRSNDFERCGKSSTVRKPTPRWPLLAVALGSCSLAAYAQDVVPGGAVDRPTFLLAVGTLLAALASLYQAHITNRRLRAQNDKDESSSELDAAEVKKIEAELAGDLALRRRAEAAEGAREVFAGYQALIDTLRKELSDVKRELSDAKKQHREEIEELRAQMRKMAESHAK